MNPTSNRDLVLARFKKGPTQLEKAIAGLQDTDLDANPSRGGWTIRQIVHHIADGDDLWKAGIKAALGNHDGDFSLSWYSSTPQREWAESWNYAQRSLAPSIALLKASRDHIVQLVEQVPDAWNRKLGVSQPSGEVESVSVGFVVGMQADHLEHHVNQILAIRNDGKGT